MKLISLLGLLLLCTFYYSTSHAATGEFSLMYNEETKDCVAASNGSEIEILLGQGYVKVIECP